MKALLLYICCCFFFVLHITAQDIHLNRFSLMGIKQGLTDNNITDVIQDSFGFVWISTKKGLNRYDGKNVIQYYADSNRNSLPQDHVWALKMLPGNKLAAFTSTGLFVINTKTLNSKAIIIPADSLKYEYKVNVVMDAEGDNEGNIFILTRSGMYAVDKNNKLWFRYDHYSAIEVQSKTLAYGTSVVKLNNDEYLLSTIKGSELFNKQKKTITALNGSYMAFLKNLSSNEPIFRTLYKTDKDFFVLNDNIPNLEYYNTEKNTHFEIPITQFYRNNFDWRSKAYKINDSLFVISGEEKGFYFIHFNTRAQSFSFDTTLHFKNFSCKAFLVDRDNRLWVGTSKGLFKQKSDGDFIEVFSLPENIYGETTDVIFNMVSVSDNKIFASSRKGLFIFNRNTGQVIQHFDFSQISQESKYISCILKLNEDSLLIAPNAPLIIFNPKTFKYSEARLPGWDSTNWIASMHLDYSSTLFLATNDDEKIYIRKKGESFRPPQNHEKNPMYALSVATNMTSDKNNNTWFCGHGISRYNSHKGFFDLRMDSFPRVKISRREIGSLVIDKNDKMYFSLVENGLLIYHPDSKNYEQLTRSNGLPDNNIKALYLLDNLLWIGTESGLATYNLETKKINSYGSLDDEKPEIFFTGYKFYYDSIHHHLYAPCNNAIIRFDPRKFNNNTTSPAFFIESIHINNDKILHHPANTIIMESGRKNLVINLASINFADAFNEQLYYRLNEKAAWEYLGKQKNFIISNLEEGAHHIEFMLESKTNSWEPKIIILDVNIKPPYWKSAWFVAMSILIILSAIWLLYKGRINRIRQKANIDKQLAELEMKSLHAQMNPHFIFNALNSIKEMVWENDKQNASKYLSKFAQLIRTTLDQSRQTFITVKQCVQHLEQYLEMEKIRFEEFSYSIETDKKMDWDEIRMAPMLVQPLVENAIWHGLKNTKADKLLEIKFYQEEKHIVCEIADNGPGINHHAVSKKAGEMHRSISIANIHNRLQMLNEKYNMHCSLEFIDKADMNPQEPGTIAILRLSL